MQLETRKYLDRNAAILSFVEQRAAFLATWPRALELRDTLQTLTAEIAQLSSRQSGNQGSGSQTVALKQTLIDALTQDLQDMARTAKAMARTNEGIERKFVMPRSQAEQSIVGAAREFLENAAPAPVKAEFVALGMAPDFLTDLTDDIARYEEMATSKNSARQNSEQSLRELDEKIGQSAQIADALNAMIKNIYHADPATLAVWESAKRISHVRAHRKKVA